MLRCSRIALDEGETDHPREVLGCFLEAREDSSTFLELTNKALDDVAIAVSVGIEHDRPRVTVLVGFRRDRRGDVQAQEILIDPVGAIPLATGQATGSPLTSRNAASTPAITASNAAHSCVCSAVSSTCRGSLDRCTTCGCCGSDRHGCGPARGQAARPESLSSTASCALMGPHRHAVDVPITSYANRVFRWVVGVGGTTAGRGRCLSISNAGVKPAQNRDHRVSPTVACAMLGHDA